MNYQAVVFASTLLFLLVSCGSGVDQNSAADAMKPVRLMIVEPGHFHAGLVLKNMYNPVDSVVHVFAPEGPELEAYMSLVNQYNTRSDDPTHWVQKVYSGEDFFEKMITDQPGNVVVLSGNNARKTDYIQQSVASGLHVLADKPMVINPEGFVKLKQTFEQAEETDVLLYDIMTERYEITTVLQKALSRFPDVFGNLKPGTKEDPSITKESVHHFFKYVSGNPLKRPAWFFDVTQQGEGIVDVATHLVDLVFWECFPEQSIDYQTDIEVLSGRRFATELTPSQFERVTGLANYPDYLMKDVQDSILRVYSNGEIFFTVNDVHAKVSVIWNYEAPEGAKDTHYSIMKGTKANLVIRQDKPQNYLTTLYVEPIDEGQASQIETGLKSALSELEQTYPGLSYIEAEHGWEIQIPDQYKIGHEAHFAQVTEAFLKYLEAGTLPEWEVPNMIAKYFVTTEAYRLTR